MADGIFPQMASTHYPLPRVPLQRALARAHAYALDFSYPGILAEPEGCRERQNTAHIAGASAGHGLKWPGSLCFLPPEAHAFI